MTPTIIGRACELADLAARYAAATQGPGSAVLVTGEAGIGKTTVVEQLRRHAASSGTRCSRVGPCPTRAR
ncbi:MAG: AAA family ATPase [Haloechinothrix sp.]